MTNNLLSEEIDSLYEKVMRLGWDKGWNDFINTLNPKRFKRMLNLTTEDLAGWKFLLNLSTNESVLNVDTSLGSSSMSLAKNFKKVYILNFDIKSLKCIEIRVKNAGFHNISCHLGDDKSHIPFPDGHFDTVILHNVEEMLQPLAIQELLKEAHRVLKASGTVLLTIKNKFSYNNFLSKSKRKGHFSIFSVERMLKRKGFSNRRTYLFYPNIDRISEIMGFNNRVSDGAITVKERLKEIIFGSIFFKYFSPVIAVIGYKEKCRPEFVENLINEIEKNEDITKTTKPPLTIKQYLISYDKVILTIGRAGQKYNDVLIQLPLSNLCFNRCEQEAKILKELNARPTTLSDKIPLFYYEGKFCSQHYFVSSRINGVSVDLPTSSVITIIIQAADKVIKFHKDTSCEYRIDEMKFKEIFLQPIDKLSQILDNNNSKELDHIKDYLKDRLIGKKINLVWEHGDFSHENMLINPRTMKISGVIDWEMSRKEGLPLLDLLYLLIRSKMLFEQKDFSAVFIEKILPLKLSDFENDIFSRYIQIIHISKELIPSLLIMFWINHITYRAGIQMYNNWLDENIYKVIHSVRQYIQNAKRSVN